MKGLLKQTETKHGPKTHTAAYSLKHIGKYFLLYAALMSAFLLFLVAGAFVPQGCIDRNFTESIPYFAEEGNYPKIGDQHRSSRLDNFTDALILMHSASMRAADIDSILTNPQHVQKTDPVASMESYLENRNSAEGEEYYVRYWMGFRTPVRILLSVLNYAQIRNLLAYTFFILLACSMFFVSRHLDMRTGFLFFLSVLLVKPHVICNSLQFSSCFIIAILAMFMIPGILKKNWVLPFFFAIGSITMFLDFYTTPQITLGYPLIFLLLLLCGEKKPKELINVSIRIMIAWIMGYAFAWLGKLLLTTLFTDINGFANGLGSFAARVGIVKKANLLKHYNLLHAFGKLLHVVLPDLLLATIVLIPALIIWLRIKRNDLTKISIKQASVYSSLLVPVFFLIVWYIVAAQPISIHAWFQYRAISMAYWSLMMYCSLLIYPLRHESR